MAIPSLRWVGGLADCLQHWALETGVRAKADERIGIVVPKTGGPTGPPVFVVYEVSKTIVAWRPYCQTGSPFTIRGLYRHWRRARRADAS